MKKYFLFFLLLAILFEVANVYFIMPMPGSQKMNSINLAYFLYSYRWVFRITIGLLLAISTFQSIKGKFKLLKLIGLLIFAAVVYLFNFKMNADAMFRKLNNPVFSKSEQNKIGLDRIVLGFKNTNEAAAYPIQFLGYHHQVRDVVGGQEVMVTYCTVCRTGRVYKPMVNGKSTQFRLVGMDHFNAMFEDEETKSWWRQSTGECVAGKLKGQKLEELPFVQVSLGDWLMENAQSKILQSSKEFEQIYKGMDLYESGKNKSTLTGTDTASWKDKSWVLGIENNGKTKAYDWNLIANKLLLQDKEIMLVMSKNKSSFYAFNNIKTEFKLSGDTLIDVSKNKFLITGISLSPNIPNLNRINIYQEFWHSWKTFHPNTEKY